VKDLFWSTAKINENTNETLQKEKGMKLLLIHRARPPK